MMDLRSIVTSVRGGDRAAVDVVGEHLAIAEATNEQTNAFIELDAEGAHARAMSVDAATDPGALRGVPIALKDLIDHVGHVTTAGSDFYRYQPIASATVVDRLEAAGAVIIGRTGLHEFAYGFSSENAWFGPVRNPWDLSLSPGGSSGGSAAAVSSGAVPVAIGTDTGGSVRVPAALCGIVGLKVTHGRVPLTGVFPLAESLDTVGPLARTVDDAAALYDVIRGADPSDPWSVDVADQPSQFTSLTGLRVGVPMAWAGAVPTSNGTTRAFDEFRSALTDLGATVDSIAAADLVPHPHLVTLSAAEAGQVHRQWFTDIDKRYGPHVEERLAAAMEVTVDQHIAARRWQAGIVQAARGVFSSHDVLLTPTVGHGRKIIGEDDIDLDGSATFYRPVLSGFAALVNVFSCPAIALPLLRPGIPPPSVQFIAPWWQESLLIDIGRALEREGLVGTHRPSGI